MKKTILLFLILGLFACETKEQENKAVQDVTSSAQSASLPQRDSLVQFPKDWEGRYEGEMHWYVNGQLRGVIPCRHEVLPQKSGFGVGKRLMILPKFSLRLLSKIICYWRIKASLRGILFLMSKMGFS